MLDKYILAICGKSGSGKSSIVGKFLEQNIDFLKILNYTTRQKRSKDDNDYEFISKDDFLKKRRKKEIIEINKKSENRYGLGKPENNKNVTILSPEGIKFLKIYCERFNIKLLSIFLDTKDDILYERLIKRGENADFIKQRLFNEKGWETSGKEICDKSLDVSDDIEIIYKNFNLLIIDVLGDKQL
ncbi:MAG: hypothetical protein PHR68_01860 [Candidatus Gracilibacteria bacterium]|nr:hypothetical protein [Candidatus Gracilibacteria bacterium]